ncbi:hypothetical protein V7113_30530 [Priestia megaterium]|uniref:hypothetical protein n=1 Tax=Priestia megaterium TaxID=1404 RepID=UPI002FFFF619
MKNLIIINSIIIKSFSYVSMHGAVLTIFKLHVCDKTNTLTQSKPLSGVTYSYEDTENIAIARVKEGVNEEKERVEPVKVTFSWQELKQYTQRVINEILRIFMTKTTHYVLVHKVVLFIKYSSKKDD